MTSDDPDPPLFDALWSLSGLTARHHLREDPAMTEHYQPRGRAPDPGPELSPDPTAYGLPAEHRYGSDDTPGGPPAPPLGEPYTPPPSFEQPSGFERPGGDTPYPELVTCPTCGGGVHPDRLGR